MQRGAARRGLRTAEVWHLRGLGDPLPALDGPRGNRFFCCASVIRGEPLIDHFVPWSRYPLDLEHNYVQAGTQCNGDEADRLAAFELPLARAQRSARVCGGLRSGAVPCDAKITRRVGPWPEDASRAEPR